MMDKKCLPRTILCSFESVQLKPPSKLWHIPLHLFGILHSSMSTPKLIVVSYDVVTQVKD